MNAGVPDARCRRGWPSAAGVVADAGDAEVEHLEDALGREEEVLRLDVAVDDALVVRGGEHVEELVAEREHLAAAGGGRRRRARGASSVSPSSSSITRKAAPSSATSSSSTRTAPGWPMELAT